jgi:hypothetical protein
MIPRFFFFFVSLQVILVGYLGGIIGVEYPFYWIFGSFCAGSVGQQVDVTPDRSLYHTQKDGKRVPDTVTSEEVRTTLVCHRF